MVTHDASIGHLADRRIDLAHGHLELISTSSPQDEERFDHLLEQIWISGEEGVPAEFDRVRASGVGDATHLVGRLADRGLVTVASSEVAFTPRGENRARDVVRRRRLAERLFTDTFAIAGSEVDTNACKFEHIISPELEQKICAFLGHPATCPHGNPIPSGPCCPKR
jgi:DtxR family Mn-dependent transcriptional regulator